MSCDKEKKWKNILEKKDKNELIDLAKKMDISSRVKTKKEIIEEMIKVFRKYEKYNHEKKDRFIKIKQLGDKGRESRTFLVTDRDTGKKYAMKTYRKNKSSKSLKDEYYYQELAAKEGISPAVISLDTVNKTMIMEKLDIDLVDLMKRQGGVLTERQQKRIINIFKKLDEIKVFHLDANPLNFMAKRGRIYIIDYGFSKKITPRLCTQFKSLTPNIDYMTISFIKQIKYYYPDSNFEYICKFITKEAMGKIEIKEF